MRGLVVFGFLISTIIVCVLSENDQQTGAAQNDKGDLAVRSDQVHVRSKRSPYHPVLPALLLGKSFLIGALVGRATKRGWGRPRVRGWGWRPAPHAHHHHPVVVHHEHSHGGWGGWEAPAPVVSTGWGWAR